MKEYVQEGVQKVAQKGAKELELFQYLLKEFFQGITWLPCVGSNHLGWEQVINGVRTSVYW